LFDVKQNGLRSNETRKDKAMYDIIGMDDALGADDVLGADDILGDDDMLGARRSGRGGWRARLRRGAPGAPPPSEMMMPLGLGQVVFTSSSPTTQTLTASPQLAFRAERLVLTVARSGGAAAIGVSVRDLRIGQRSQLVSAQSIPAEAFSPSAFGVRLALDPAAPGLTITLDVAVSAAPGGTDTVTVIGALIGRAIG
jgi:hypothetical protein